MSTAPEMAVNSKDHSPPTSNGQSEDKSDTPPSNSPPSSSPSVKIPPSSEKEDSPPSSTVPSNINGNEKVVMQNGDTHHFPVHHANYNRRDVDIVPTSFHQYDLNMAVLENVEGEERVIRHSPDNRFLKYDLEIGRGSFKTVYKGVDTETGVAVAWCELMESKFDKAEQMRFKDEVKILKTLNNPYILRLYDSWEYPHPTDKKRVLVLITELMTSGTLKGYMKRLKSIKPRMIRSWGRQILKGLHFLHTRTPPIIHRDLKCDNIFINGTTGVVKIGDLGLATLKRSDVKTVIGTPEFMAPEMYEELYDESVDVYAFGMCLIEMTTGEYPYRECQNPAQIFKRVTNGVLPLAIDRIEDPALKEVIGGCIKGEKKDRYNVKNLLDHEFFAEGELKVEVVEGEGAKGDVIFRMEVPNRENKKDSKQESVEFSYSLHSDIPEKVVEEMVKSGLLREEDRKNVIRTVREHVGTQKKRLQEQNLTPSSADSTGVDSKSDVVSVLITDTLTTPIDNDNNHPKLHHQNSVSSDVDVQESTNSSGKPHENGVSNISKDFPTEETLLTPPISNQSSPALQLKNSDLPIVQEETEDDKSGDSEGEEKKGINKNKERLTRRDSHPPEESGNKIGKEGKKSSDDGTSKITVGQGEGGEIPGDTTTAHSRMQETTPPVNETGETSSTVSSQQDSSDHNVSGGAGSRKKSSRSKDSKKALRLKLVDRYSTGVVSCSLCVGDRTVNFKFSTEYDRPKDIFQNMLKAAHLAKKDEEDFIKKLTEIIDSIKRDECLVPIKEGPEGGSKGEGHSKNSDSPDIPISRSRAGSTKQSSKDDGAQSESGQGKDSKPPSDKADISSSTVQPTKSDKKETSVPPADGSSKTKKRAESTTEHYNKPPLILSQSSSESVSALSPSVDSQPLLLDHTTPPIAVSSTDNSHASILPSKTTPTTAPYLLSSTPGVFGSQLVSNSVSSLQTGSTTIIQTDKKRFEIEEVSFTSEEGLGDPPDSGKGSSIKGGVDSETASQCGGLESASSNSMQSDSHPVQDSNIGLQADSGNLQSSPPFISSSHHPVIPNPTIPPPAATGGLEGNKEIFNGIAKFLYLMNNILKDPDMIRLTTALEQQFGQPEYKQVYNTNPHQATPFNQQHGVTPPLGGAGGISSVSMTPFTSQTHLGSADQVDGGESDLEYEEYCQQVQKEFEEKERKLLEEKKLKLKRFQGRRGNYSNIHSTESVLTGSSNQSGGNHMIGSNVGTSSASAYQLTANTGPLSTGGGVAGTQQLQVVRNKSTGGSGTGDMQHPSHYSSVDQRELFHSGNSHSPSRDLTTGNQPSQPNQNIPPPHPNYPPTNNMGQSGQQAPPPYFTHERYPQQQTQQSQSPIPNQGQVSIPQNQGQVPIPQNQGQVPIPQNQGQVPIPQNQGQVPNQQAFPPTYMYFPHMAPYHHPHHPTMYPHSNGSYPSYMPASRVPDLPPDADHQNSITQKR